MIDHEDFFSEKPIQNPTSEEAVGVANKPTQSSAIEHDGVTVNQTQNSMTFTQETAVASTSHGVTDNPNQNLTDFNQDSPVPSTSHQISSERSDEQDMDIDRISDNSTNKKDGHDTSSGKYYCKGKFF